MNFFSGLFPHFPGHSRENTGTGVRRRSQSPAERTPILPGKYSSTSRKKLEYSPKRTGNGYGIATATIRIYAFADTEGNDFNDHLSRPRLLSLYNAYYRYPMMGIIHS